VVIAIVILAVVAAWCFRIHNFRSILAYWYMRQGCHPIWRDLAWRNVRAGENLGAFLSLHKPSIITRFDNYTKMQFFKNYNPEAGVIHFTGITVIATDNELVCAVAWSCTWHHSFFSTLSTEEKKGYRESFRRYVDSLAPPPGQE